MTHTREAVKKIKNYFSRIREIEKAICEARLEQERERYGSDGMPRSTRLSDPTAQRALKRLEPIRTAILSDGTWIERPEDWVTVYRETCRFFAYSEAKTIIQKRFVERKSVERTLLDIGCLSRKTFFTLQDQVVYFALGVAEGMGLFGDLAMVKEKTDQSA